MAAQVSESRSRSHRCGRSPPKPDVPALSGPERRVVNNSGGGEVAGECFRQHEGTRADRQERTR
eukprot:1075031-Alexandrium_andersonii.AAC.1